MKKIIIAVALITGFLSLTTTSYAEAPLPRYNQPYQGLFRCHAYDAVAKNIVKGGAQIVLWSQIQPTDPDTMDNKENSFDHVKLLEVVNLIKQYYAGGKKTYLNLATFSATDVGGLPNWAWTTTNPPKIKVISGPGADGNVPSPWDENYRRLLRDYLEYLSKEFDEHEVTEMIEYIEPSVGGIYGSTHLWTREETGIDNWVAAAGCPARDYTCLGTRYTEAVNWIIDLYETTFKDLPIMVIGGGCRHYECRYQGIDTEVGKWGVKMMYKQAGLGKDMPGCGQYAHEFVPICSGNRADQGIQTRCGQETWGASVLCISNPNEGGGFDPNSTQCATNYHDVYYSSILRDNASYYCMYAQELRCTNAMTLETNQYVVDHLGAQIRLVSPSFSALSANVNSNITLNTTWENTGSTVLLVPLKTTTKWVPSSYKLLLEFEKDNTLVHQELLDINPPTNKWQPDRNFCSKTIAFTVPISSALGGETDNSEQTYKVYASLTDPNGENKRFVLINTEAANDVIRRRYLLTDNLIVRGKGNPLTPTPSPTGEITPSPEPSGSPTPTPSSSPNSATLSFRFQGITTKKADQKATIQLNKGSETIREFTDVSIVNNDQGVFSATLADIPADTYDIYIKGWVHLRKKFPQAQISQENNTLDLSSQTMIAGDFTGNNVLDIEDVSDMVSKFTNVSNPTNDSIKKYDINLDGILDIEDLSLVISNFTDVSVNGD